MVQDEAQGYHWVNNQATVHPFAFYYKDEKKVKSHSFHIICDHVEHNTTTVHAFQLQLTNYNKEHHPFVRKFFLLQGCRNIKIN